MKPNSAGASGEPDSHLPRHPDGVAAAHEGEGHDQPVLVVVRAQCRRHGAAHPARRKVVRGRPPAPHPDPGPRASAQRPSGQRWPAYRRSFDFTLEIRARTRCGEHPSFLAASSTLKRSSPSMTNQLSTAASIGVSSSPSSVAVFLASMPAILLESRAPSPRPLPPAVTLPRGLGSILARRVRGPGCPFRPFNGGGSPYVALCRDTTPAALVCPSRRASNLTGGPRAPIRRVAPYVRLNAR